MTTTTKHSFRRYMSFHLHIVSLVSRDSKISKPRKALNYIFNTLIMIFTLIIILYNKNLKINNKIIILLKAKLKNYNIYK